MGKLKLAVTKDGIEEAADDPGDLVLPPKGVYILRLESVTPGYKKTEGGGEDKSKPNAKFQWKIVGVGREGAEPEANFMHIFDYVTFSKETQWKRDDVGYALGLSTGRAKSKTFDLEIDPDVPGTVIGTQVLGRIKIEKQDGYDPSPKIAKLHPLAASDQVPDAFADDDETSEEPPEDDPFEGDEEEPEEEGEEGEDEESEDEDLLTMEDLEAMTGAELAATAKDFDIDPADFTGKGRSAAAKKKNKMQQVREAILEAQGAEEGDDEDPF